MSTKITLAGDEIEIHELPARQNKRWRERATAPLAIQRNIVHQAEAGDASKAPDLYQQYVNLVNDHFDDIFDLVIERLPVDQQAHYADHATQTEILTAFLVLVKESFSTGFFWALTGEAFLNGAAGQATGKNSPAPNGDTLPISWTA
jgi:hypothetical protein